MKPIRNDQSHRDALERVNALLAIDPPVEPGSRKGDELDVLVDLIEGYEAKRFPIDLPSPLAAIQFRMEQAGLKQPIRVTVKTTTLKHDNSRDEF